MSTLNTPQQEAVHHLGGPLLVLAGAGSGKTRVITFRIAWLIKNRSINPADILAVTFTNKAAREMSARLGSMLRGLAYEVGPRVSTFHALGMRILQSETRLAGLRPGFSILDPRDVPGVVAEVLRSNLAANSEMAEVIARRISTLKNLGISPAGTEADERDPLSVAVTSVYPAYQRYLRACNTVDLDDLLLLPVEVLKAQPDRLRHWQLQIRYLLVDEYQDTNEVQYQLIRLLAGNGRGLTVVGDDDQSIYAWRGARPQNLVRLADDFADLKLLKLEQNYRSRGRILGLANHLIRNNTRSFEKTLWSELGHGDPVRIVVANGERDEARKTVSTIMRKQFQSRCRFGDFAVLYRGNHQSREIELQLREMRIPYRVSGGSSFFDRGEVRDVMAYLRLLSNPSDDSALLRIINTPRRGIGSSTLEKLAARARSTGCSLFDVLGDDSLAIELQPRQAKVLQGLYGRLTEIRRLAENGDPVQAAEEMLSYIEYRRWLYQNNEADVAERRWENVLLLLDWLATSARAEKPDEARSLGDLVNDMMLNELSEREDEEQDGNRVNLMTLHASKGLEFPHVIIIGVEEDYLPHHASVDSGDIEEERRLLYVGITRAMQTLQFSYTSRRKRFGEWIDREPSRFLHELPADDLQWDSETVGDSEESMASGRAQLANIRAMRQGSGIA